MVKKKEPTWWARTYFDRDTTGGPLIFHRKIKLKAGRKPDDKTPWGDTISDQLLDREASNYGSIMMRWYRGSRKMFERWW